MQLICRGISQSSLNLNRSVFTIDEADVRKLESANFQALRKDCKAVAVPPEHLNEVAALASKEKQCAGKGILSDQRLNKRKQSIEAAPHIDGFRADEDLY